MDEFDLIARLAASVRRQPGTRLGIGDDAALIEPPAGALLAVATDTLIEGVHFLAGCPAAVVAARALAANLSDLAAMGARPRAFTLALTLPAADPAWVEAFAEALGRLAEGHRIELIGGDTTEGPLLVVTLQVLGEVAEHAALRRAGARPGDLLCVSGVPGEAALGLACLKGAPAATTLEADLVTRLIDRFEHPLPRLALGQALAGVATAAIDISDGLLADLGHLCRASGCGARVALAALPDSAALAAWPDADARRAARLAGGDDYELLFCLPPAARAQITALAHRGGVALSVIGEMTAQPEIEVLDAEGRHLASLPRGYRHFTTRPGPAAAHSGP